MTDRTVADINDIVRLGYGMIQGVMHDLSPAEWPKSPQWRFYIAPATYRDWEYILHTSRSVDYIVDDVRGSVHRTAAATMTPDMPPDMRLFGLPVLPDAQLDRNTIELRYTHRETLASANQPPEPHTGHPAHP